MRSRKHREAIHHLKWDFVVVAASVVVAIILVNIGFVSNLLTLTQGMHLLAAFVSGILFTSLFTIAPASIALVEIGTQANILTISLAGAVGAVFGDMLLYYFIRDTVVEDLKTIVKSSSYRRFVAHFHGGVFRWLSPLIGAVIIASPLPDELGLAMLGFARVRSVFMIPITFTANFLGIWAVISVANLL